jgi:hypothetical protein
MDSMDKEYHEKEHVGNTGEAATKYFAYKRYKDNTGIHPLAMSRAQAAYLNTFSIKALLFYLAFTHIDETDGIANEIGRHILSYVGINWRMIQVEELNARLHTLYDDIKNAPSSAAVQSLINKGANINTRQYGNTVLMRASGCGNIGAVNTLLAADNINVNLKSNDRQTALMKACGAPDPVEVIKLLLSIPTINIHLKDKEGRTALDLVKGKGKEDTIKALFQGELTSFLPSLTFTLLSC